jgi:hypothetical protein
VDYSGPASGSMRRARLVPGAGSCVLAALLACVSLAGCRQGVPVIDTAPKPAQQDGTISGTVRGPEGTSPIEGRVVQVVNVDTGERQSLTTSSTGGFTFKLKPGKYRVEITLREGESILKGPGILDVNRSDVDAHADFVIAASRISRPHYPAGDGEGVLGPPIA